MSQYVVSVEYPSLIYHSLLRDLFVSSFESLIGYETFMRTKCFEPLQKQRARVGSCKTCLYPQQSITDPSKAVLLLWFLNVTCCYVRGYTVSSIWSPE